MKRLQAMFFKSKTDGSATRRASLLPSPLAVRGKYPLNKQGEQAVLSWRQSIVDILNRLDDRFLAIVGPCSVHNEKAALEYFCWLKSLADRFGDKIFVVGRCCVEKPRTRSGWEGALADWFGNNSRKLEQGIYHCRRLLAETVKIGLPIALETLDPNTEQFFSDLLPLAWVGARNVEAMPTRREITGMSMPVGIKNATSGDVTSAIDAMVYADNPNAFPGLDLKARLAAIETLGNENTFLVLRGGKRPDYARRESEAVFDILAKAGVAADTVDECRKILGGDIRPNYSAEEIALAVAALKKEGIMPKIVVDASHSNSRKKYEKQIEVWKSVVEQRAAGNLAIRGGMLESYTKSGNQKYQGTFDGLDPETSITDACLGKEETEELLSWTYEQL